MIRIISGQFKGRALQCPPTARPPLMKTRQAVFNILAHEVSWAEMVVADCFAGSGGYGFEALSRGAKHAYFIENNPVALRTISENAQHLKVTPHTHVIRATAPLLPPAPQKTNLIFLDPPYHQGLVLPTLQALTLNGWADDTTLFVLETQAKEEIDFLGVSQVSQLSPNNSPEYEAVSMNFEDRSGVDLRSMSTGNTKMNQKTPISWGVKIHLDRCYGNNRIYIGQMGRHAVDV